jgi:hypothetical protein
MTRGIFIPVVVGGADGSRYCLIELQGTIEMVDPSLSVGESDEAIIDLKWKDPDTPILYLGQQILYGTRDVLKKPLILVKRTRMVENVGSNAPYSIEFIQKINERLIFLQRPQQQCT